MSLTTYDFWHHYLGGQREFLDVTIHGGGSISLAGKQLTGVELRYVSLSEVNLNGANLDRAILVDVTCRPAQLQGVSLSDAQLREAHCQHWDLARANLKRANLTHAQLQYVSFQEADLRGANLTAANLRGANLIGTDLRDAILGTAVLEEVRFDDTTKWPLTGAFSKVQLSPSMTVVQLTGRTKLAQVGEEQERVPVPGRGGTLLSVASVQEAILKDWHSRPEQPGFRKAVIQAAQKQCAVSGSDDLDGLEAAHIVPYTVAEKQEKGCYTNGLLLRADVHKLFDLGRLTIDPERGIIILDEKLQQSRAYQCLHGLSITLPAFPPASICDREKRWRENLHWRQEHYQRLIANGKLFGQGGK